MTIINPGKEYCLCQGLNIVTCPAVLYNTDWGIWAREVKGQKIKSKTLQQCKETTYMYIAITQQKAYWY